MVEIIANWHKASDGRGLTEEARKKYILAMLDFLLDCVIGCLGTKKTGTTPPWIQTGLLISIIFGMAQS